MSLTPPRPRLRMMLRGLASSLMSGALALGMGCMALTPQLPATDVAALARLEPRADREAQYAENQIFVHHEARGTRYTKGNDPNDVKRSWQSLDSILRSDVNSAAALPHRKLRTSRILVVLAVASGLVAVAGFAASARDGLDLFRLDGPGAVLLTGGVLSLGFGVAAGVTYGRAKTDYTRAVEIYNDSVGMRMGLYSPAGQYIPADGVLVDQDGFVVLTTPELEGLSPPAAAATPEGPVPAQPDTPPQPDPAAQPSTTPPGAPAPQPNTSPQPEAGPPAKPTIPAPQPEARPPAKPTVPMPPPTASRGGP